ncbi:hypothetical protein K458DRAFT_399679 [Lentithecium fluviatile CBS 122367]|uniref:Uncharacterized protein n=1 Tax=Lentithecium fluviatile CBS 122367 TaxID=1168545 RepID=A0A6G1JJL2_9PLEO|nr:hypothetical protein K458DRAFT_399679 [Lentithecium fluviatile CBS 122367]
MAYHRLTYLRPIPQAEEQIPEPLRTPAAPSYAHESIPKPSPSTPKMVHETCAPLVPGPCPTPAMVPSPSTLSSASEPTSAQPATENDPSLPIPERWPSQIAQSSSTMWLLPPHSSQSSAIAQLLQTEIQSHNITQEMLHATENCRLEAVRKYNSLVADTHSWITANNNLTSALYKCSEECSRLSAENVSLKTQLQCINMQSTFQLDDFALENKKLQIVRKNPSHRFSDEGQVKSMRVDSNPDASTTSMTVAQVELEDSPSPYSPEG